MCSKSWLIRTIPRATCILESIFVRVCDSILGSWSQWRYYRGITEYSWFWTRQESDAAGSLFVEVLHKIGQLVILYLYKQIVWCSGNILYRQEEHCRICHGFSGLWLYILVDACVCLKNLISYELHHWHGNLESGQLNSYITCGRIAPACCTFLLQPMVL